MKIHWYALEFLALDYKIIFFKNFFLVIANVSHIHYILNLGKNTPWTTFFGQFNQTNT
jgi:hypothetical protein